MKLLLIFSISTFLVLISKTNADRFTEFPDLALRDANQIQNGINEAIKAHDREKITSYFSHDLKYYDCSGNHAFLENYIDILYEWYPNGPSTEIRNPQHDGILGLTYDMTEKMPNAVYKTRTHAKWLEGKWVITNRTAIDC